VVFLANAYRPVRGEVAGAPQVPAAEARRLAGELLAVEGSLLFDVTELVVFPTAERAYLAWRVRLAPASFPIGDWEVLVDAVTGEVLRVADRALYGSQSGHVWLPDPLSSATADYGDPGYTDDNDDDTAQLTAEIVSQPLLDLTQLLGGDWTLVGPWADCRELESPAIACPTEADGVFDYGSRSDDRFEPVNVYQAIDAYMRHINVTLGIALTPYQYAGGVRYDPHGLSGADNSHYVSSTGIVAFGDGGVDDAEDDDVVIHELGHGIHDWITDGGLSQVQGLSEGVGDYVAASYSRWFAGQWGPADPQYNWVFSWDGHNPFWPGRRTDWNDFNLYTTSLGGLHQTGQFWASCNIDVNEAIGSDEADRAMLTGLAMTTSSTNQAAAAQAVITAAETLGYPPGTISTMVEIFNTNTGSAGCNYGVESEIFSDGFESGDTGGGWVEGS
jgi:hypothetical protein